MEGDLSDTLSESVRLHFDGSGVSFKSSVASESSLCLDVFRPSLYCSARIYCFV